MTWLLGALLLLRLSAIDPQIIIRNANDCDNEPKPAACPPVLTALTPNSGVVTGSVVITGQMLGATQSTSTVTFNGVAAPATAWSQTSVIVMVPAGATTGNVVLTRGGTASNALTFTVIVQGLNPITAPRHADTAWAAAGVEGGIPTTRTRCTTGTGTSVLASTSSAAQINTAITGCDANHYVELGTGTFSLSTGITLHTNSVTLKGQGANLTKLVFTGSVGGYNYFDSAAISMCTGDQLYGDPNGDGTAVFADVQTTWTPLGAGGTWTASVGATQITVASATGLAAGLPIFLDQLNDSVDGYPSAGDLFVCTTSFPCSNQGGGGNAARSGKAQTVLHKVTGVSGTTVTIDPPLYLPNWRSTQAPGAWWNTSANASWLHDTGVEDLSIDITAAGTGVAAVAMHATFNCWVKGVRSVTNDTTGGSELFHILMINGFHNTIRSNYFDGPDGPDGNQRYAISLLVVSQTLIENNIFSRTTAGPVPNGPVIGTVIAYNYVRAATMTSGGTVMHGFTEMNLHEGNNMSGLLGDIIHAPHYFETAFRNLFDRTTNNPGVNIDTTLALRSHMRFWNVVGNVVGDGSATTYQQVYTASGSLSDCSGCLFSLGWEGNDSFTGSGRVATDGVRVRDTLFRWGNWDTETAAVRWCGSATGLNGGPNTGWTTTCASTSEVPSTITSYPNSLPSTETLPSSLYLSAKPAWFQSIAYPPIGPDIGTGAIAGYVGHAHKIPARVCWESLSDDGGYTAGTVKVFNATTCYGTP